MHTRKARLCGDCGREYRFSISDSYRYTESGLENVYLRNVETMTCECGTAVVLHSLPTLLRVIAFCFAHKPALLKGREIRFVRSVLGHSGKDFAEMLALTPEHFSRVENEREPVSESIDKITRFRIALNLLEVDAFARIFDRKQFRATIDRRLPAPHDGMALYLTYTGPYLGAQDGPLDFEFREAA